MVEHTRRDGDRVVIERNIQARRKFRATRDRSAARRLVLQPGKRLGFAEIALLAMVGRAQVLVFRKPRVAILPTGDEIVERRRQRRTTSRFAIRTRGRSPCRCAEPAAFPKFLPIARDNYESTRAMIEHGLAAPICCCCPAASPPASTISSKRCWPISARSSSSTASRFSRASPWCLEPRRVNFLRTAGESGLDHGDIRIVRPRRDREVERLRRRAAPAVAREAYSRVSPQSRTDAISARDSKRRWFHGDSGGLAWIGRYSFARRARTRFWWRIAIANPGRPGTTFE